LIRIDRVHKWFGSQLVLDGVDIHVRKGTLFLLCGQSGAGKSTLLATVNGLEPIQKGAIYLDGVPLAARASELRAQRRQIGVVFQSYNLFGHMTVEQNVRLGLERSLGLGKLESTRLAQEHLERVGMSHKRDAYPAELSGGQQQRVAIARCLAMRPKVLLMDEPTAALDIDNSAEVVATIRSLKSDGMTILLATHQIDVFAHIADELACMMDGRIIERGTLSELSGPGRAESQIAAWLAVRGGGARNDRARSTAGDR